MFFTKLGQVIAWLLVIVGGSQAMLAFAVAFTTGQSPRYFGSKPTGEAIDAGMLYVLIGVAVGIVAEISRSVAAKAEVKKQELK
ncbi:hypothetical protein [Mesorhizobium sp.]|uniref:hypothetical protein n=1 Tax=Mesorhizobium sp. TaxID=1871066 RepID=UPI001202CF30|nr:hypothetical protein [Mesorhizobium sp.]TIL40239.1 MAG: hypothetical protein E5Y82_06910 [Mesorhizobium sp.]